VIPGKENEAHRARWFETFVDHVETTKVVEKSDFTYGAGNDQTEERSFVEFRYTDNPGTRNDLWQWRSTSQQWTIRSYMDTVSNQWTVRTEDKGLVWLVDRYKPDPTYSDVAFAFEGSFSDLDEETHRFFGDDASGLKSNVKGTHMRDYLAGFGSNAVKVKGTYHTHNAMVNNADGGVHGNAAAVDGTLNVTVGGIAHDVSAEEWTLEVEP
jgi:hypothetical protein